jgi:iron complex outermembrane receptor protein
MFGDQNMRFLIAAGPVLSILISFEIQAQGADIVVSTSTRDSSPILATQSAKIITKADIERGSYVSLLDVLQKETSFRAPTDSTGAQRSASLDLRGFGETAGFNTQILIDGISFKNPTLEAPNLALIPLATVEQIEILRSSSGTLHGNGAGGGVINIITTPKSYDRNQYQFTTGSFGKSAISSHHYLPSSSVSVTADLAKNTDNGYRYFNDSNLTFGKIGLGFDQSEITHSRVLDQRNSAGSTTESIISNDRKDSAIADRSYINYRESITQLKHRGGLNGAEADIAVTHRQSDQTGAYVSYGPIQQHLDLVSINSKMVAQLDPNARTEGGWLFGADLSSGRYSSGYFSGVRKQYTTDFYGQVKRPFKNSLITTGGRIAYVKDTMHNGFIHENTLTSYEIGVTKKWDDFQIYGRIDQNFRYASLDEQSTSGDPVKPQIGRSFEIGTRFPNGLIDAFIVNNSDEILFDPSDTSQSNFGSNINVESTTRIGGSIEFNFDLTDSQELMTRVQHLDTKITAGNFNGSRVPGVSPWQATLSLKSNWSSALNTEIIHQFFSGAHPISDYDNSMSPQNTYNETRFNVSYLMSELMISMGINNLFDVDRDTYVYDNYGTIKRTPAEPRSFTLTFRYIPE